MKLEKQVCSLELAKKLKELGVKQESLYFWWGKTTGSGSADYPHKKGEGYRLVGNPLHHFAECDWDYIMHPFQEKCSAFTVAELGEMLPEEVRSEGHTVIIPDYDLYDKNYVTFTADTEANARAKMLIWLIEQGKVKV